MEIVGFSSEHDQTDYSMKKIIGPFPGFNKRYSCFPSGGTAGNQVWPLDASLSPSFCFVRPLQNYLEVRFEKSVVPTSLSVYEGSGHGSVVKISGRLDNGTCVVLWEGPKDESTWGKTRIFNPPLRPCNQRVNIIRIDVEVPQDHNHWYSAQAIQLVGSSTPSLLR